MYLSELKSALWSMWAKCRDYALRSILAKCCDLRTLPGENFELPGTFNFFEPLIRVSTFAFEMHHHFVFLWTQFKLIKFYIWIIESVICFIWFHSYRVDLNCDIWHGFGVNNIQAGHWGFIEYRPPKKNPNIDQISTTQHFIDQISTAKVPWKARIYNIYF